MSVSYHIPKSATCRWMDLGEAEDIALVSYKVDIHTLICLLGLDDGLHLFPLIQLHKEGWTEEVIRTYTGHEDFKAMKPYFAIGDKKRRMFMESHF